jgi:hypothetical protein
MRRKHKLRLIRQAKAAAPVSALSSGEEARLIELADVALHNEPAKPSPVAGDHAHREHEALKRALNEAVEKLMPMPDKGSAA